VEYYFLIVLNVNSFEEVLSISEIELQKISIFPNPSSNSLQILGLNSAENHEIYSSIGQKIKAGKILNHTAIDIQNLSDRLYLLKLENKRMFKFIKE
tara:strand:+ start:140 stop:430 length:291 start_codon:yes stop_codon:yes gene_type:complete